MRTFTDEEIRTRLLAIWINEAGIALEEGIAIKPGDVDVVTVMGFGFPSWRGGLMNYGARVGFEEICRILDGLWKESSEDFYKPSDWLMSDAAKELV